MIGTNTTTTTAWRVTLEATRTYNIETLELSSCIQTLELQGNKTRIQFNTSSLWIGEQLTTLVLSGLDLSNIALLQLPTSLKTLHITDCVLNKLPVKWLLSQLQLETLVLVNNNVMDTTRTLTELSDEQFKLLSSRVSGYLALESRVEVDQITACVKEKGGSVQKIGTWSVCVIPDDAAVIARRLLLFASIESDDTSLASSGSGLNDDQDTSTLVMASFALPFIYCLYKIGLFIFFARTRNRHCSENGGAIGRVTRDDTKNVTTATTCDSDGNRPTVNDSSASSQHSSSSRVHRKQDEHQSNSDNAGFWVNEELQPWRLDFQQLKMLRCLNLLPTVKRQTLRKQSVTSAMNPREIWLASLAKEDVSMATVSIGGDTKYGGGKIYGAQGRPGTAFIFKQHYKEQAES
ncbi:unnamed protein product [Peronospora belbahrii]|uniref:Uncharacterized protein n=1 Tax=Peronospora belbahrii TaxID=622444 RepID=A0ABN8D4M5_9STRA|nr:unnamed protein product [Peronospora belbahrii]